MARALGEVCVAMAGKADEAGRGIACEIRDVVKEFGAGPGAVRALDGVSLDIRENEFFTLLGPSGCGKTTMLRLIAGFEAVSAGHIRLHGEEIADLPPNKRPVNTVFQHYALFPHMTVADNVAFGLRRLRKPESEVGRRVQEMLDLVQLGAMGARRPGELSGGQQQRVALARALAPSPRILLLDEPLSALDLKLRQAMRIELKQLQENTGITFVFVTHDQDEALSMSDRIAVMSAGRVQQIGTAGEIYEHPVNRFVAEFIGDSNHLAVTIDSVGTTGVRCRTASGLAMICERSGEPLAGTTAFVSIRPERLRLETPGAAGDVGCTIDRAVYHGTDTQVLIRLDDGTRLQVRVPNDRGPAGLPAAGVRLGLVIPPGAARLLVD
jgi:spermidine/putrescine transport system ATP-binding protein